MGIVFVIVDENFKKHLIFLTTLFIRSVVTGHKNSALNASIPNAAIIRFNTPIYLLQKAYYHQQHVYLLNIENYESNYSEFSKKF